MSEQWLSITEYARACNMSDMTVRRRIKNGKLQAVLRDGKYYIAYNSKTKNFDQIPNTANIISQQKVSTNTTIPTMRNPIVPQDFGRNESKITEDDSSNHNIQVKPRIIPGHQTLEYQKNQSNFPHESFKQFDQIISKLERTEVYLKNQYQSKINELEAKLETKEVQIRNLKQQLEDMQLLINVIDKNKK